MAAVADPFLGERELGNHVFGEEDDWRIIEGTTERAEDERSKADDARAQGQRKCCCRQSFSQKAYTPRPPLRSAL